MTPKQQQPKVHSLLQQHDAMVVLTTWLREVEPSLEEAEFNKLVRYIAVQDKAVTPDVRKRRDAIIRSFTPTHTTRRAAWPPPGRRGDPDPHPMSIHTPASPSSGDLLSFHGDRSGSPHL